MLCGFYLLISTMASGLQPVAPSKVKVPTLKQVRALIIGIDVYQYAKQTTFTSPDKQMAYENQVPELENLVGAVKDAKDLAAFFRKNLEKADERITLLLGDESSSTTGPGAITKEKIQTALQKMAADSEEGDWLFLCYSGHGVMAKKRRDDGSMSPAPFLVMQDTRPQAIPETALAFEDLLRDFQVHGKAKHRTLLIDACNSGRMQQQPIVSINEMLINSQLSSKDDRGKNTVFLSAARGFQSSREDRNGGYFIQAFLRGLRGFARPSNTKVIVTLNDAFTYAALETRSRSHNFQTPYISGGNLHFELSNFGEGRESSCESIFDISSHPKTHRSNEDLTLMVKMKDPTLLSSWEMNLDLELIFHWRLAGNGPYQKAMSFELDRNYWVTLPKHILHSGTLEYWFSFKGGIFRNNFQFGPQNCRWTIRIRQ